MQFIATLTQPVGYTDLNHPVYFHSTDFISTGNGMRAKGWVVIFVPC